MPVWWTWAAPVELAWELASLLANAKLATNGALGRNQGDPLFEEVTERRQRWSSYS